MAVAVGSWPFERHPELLPMFPADLSRPQVKFASELETIVRAIPDFGTFLDGARQLGARHVGYGVRATHYGKVRAVLLEVIARELQPGWTDAAAWAAYDMITEAMQLGAEPALAG